MAYNASKAYSAKGAQLSINTGTASTPTWTPIYELASLTPSGYEMKTDDATNLNSGAVERVATILDGGSWDASGNWIPTDPGQVAVETAFAAGTLKQFQIQFPKGAGQASTGDLFSFSAIISKWNPVLTSADKKIGSSITLQTSNGVTYTAGS